MVRSNPELIVQHDVPKRDMINMAKSIHSADLRPSGANGEYFGVESIKRLLKIGFHALIAPRAARFMRACLMETEEAEATGRGKNTLPAFSVE